MRQLTFLTAAALVAVPAAAGAQTASGDQCAPAATKAGFELLLTVQGMDGTFLLTCRNGSLVAVPQESGNGDAGSGKAGDAAAGSGDQTAPAQAIDRSAAKAASELKQGADLQKPPAIAPQATSAAEAGPAGGPADLSTAQGGGTASDAIEESGKNAAEEMKGGADLGKTPDTLQPGPNGADQSSTAPARKAANAEATGEHQPTTAIDQSAEQASSQIKGNADLAEPPQALTQNGSTGGTSPAGSAPTPNTAMAVHAAGVAGQTPSASVSEAARDDSAAGETAMAKDAAGADETDKPAVRADEATPPGEAGHGNSPKSHERIASGETGEPDMIPVPMTVIGNAEMALPGARFDSVSLEGDKTQKIYALRGKTRRGATVLVAVDPDGHVRKVDRQIAPEDVPPPIAHITDAVLPGADVKSVMLSSRDNYRSFFVFSGDDSRGTPFVLEVRSDGRRVEFKKGG
ncbi:hypothetical protein [Jiella sp. M17.18]|uniref:hypothetical protein n=1 Tax=Jiella sp. M17.18 TaxID=3234247 RepID=UPI0034DF1000